MSIQSPSEPVNPFATTSTTATDAARQSAQRMGHDAIDSMGNRLQEARDQAAPILDRASEQAVQMARRSMEAVRDSSLHLKDTAQRVSETTTTYIKEEPMKAVLMAAATGAALMALANLRGKSSRD